MLYKNKVHLHAFDFFVTDVRTRRLKNNQLFKQAIVNKPSLLCAIFFILLHRHCTFCSEASIKLSLNDRQVLNTIFVRLLYNVSFS